MFKIIILICAALYEMWDFKKEYKRPEKRKIIGTIFLYTRLLIIGFLTWFVIDELLDQKKEKDIDALYGDFGKQKDCYKPFPVLLYNRYDAEDIRRVLYNLNGIEPPRVSQKNNQINVGIVIRDSNGDAVASISDRHWEIVNPIGIEYNNDDSGFEIKSGERVIFQIDLRQDTVVCKGMFCGEESDCFFVNNQSIELLSKKTQGPQRFTLSYNYDLMPLFVYPRRKHLGERVKSKIRNKPKKVQQ